MLNLRQEKSFVKDLQKHGLNNSELAKFAKYISLLCEGKTLPKEANDHVLKGTWLGFREFHIGGDTLYLTRLGSHSQLF